MKKPARKLQAPPESMIKASKPVPKLPVKPQKEGVVALQSVEDLESRFHEAVDITQEFAKGKAVLYLAKPDKSLKLLSATSPELTGLFAIVYAQADFLDLRFLNNFCDNYLELLVSEKSAGRKDLKEVAKTPDAPKQQGFLGFGQPRY
jgi:hypothetical protein